MAEKDSPLDIAIIGGGIAGLTLAIALLSRDISVTIYEQAPKFGEIGAGVAFSPNAVSAMKLCSPGVYDGFHKVATRNGWPSKKTRWFDFVDGYTHKNAEQEAKEQWLFKLENELGANAVHRAHFLDEMVKLIPDGVAKFGKHLDNVEETENGQVKMRFHDGSSAVADAVIGCDGIKSRLRQLIIGEEHPAAHPTYTHKYAYRGLIPMDKAKEAIGEDNAVNAKLHMGPDGHVLTFPVNQGSVMNVVAFRTNLDPWPNPAKLTLPAKHSTVKAEFEGWGHVVTSIISLLETELDCWAIFDLGDHPCPTYHKGLLCLSGDAAHATTPHHGAGAGFCIEDSCVLAALLEAAAAKVKGGAKARKAALETTFAAFDASRRERTQWLVQSSRRSGDLYEWRVEGVGKDFEKIRKECEERDERIWNADVGVMCKEACEEFERMLN